MQTQYFSVRKYIHRLAEPSKNVNSVNEYTIMREKKGENRDFEDVQKQILINTCYGNGYKWPEEGKGKKTKATEYNRNF